MASFNPSLSQQQFTCSICLEVFTEPVTTPCGHVFCGCCIGRYWAQSDIIRCPACNEPFQSAPELHVSTEFREMVELFKMTTATAVDENSGSKEVVPCTLCTGAKQRACKSCLVCVASLCKTHVKPHEALTWHTLINPVLNLDERLCKKHNKIMEFFCRTDECCVCVVCLRDGHETHDAVSIDEEINERKPKMESLKRQMDHTLNERCTMAQRVLTTKKQSRQGVEKTKAETVEEFDSLVAMVEVEKVKLIELLEEKQNAFEQQADALVGQLQLEIDAANRTSSELGDVLKIEDDFTLLHSLPSIYTPANTNHQNVPIPKVVQNFLHVDTVRSATVKVKQTLDEQMQKITRQVNLVNKEETGKDPVNELQTRVMYFGRELGAILQEYWLEVLLGVGGVVLGVLVVILRALFPSVFM